MLCCYWQDLIESCWLLCAISQNRKSLSAPSPQLSVCLWWLEWISSTLQGQHSAPIKNQLTSWFSFVGPADLGLEVCQVGSKLNLQNSSLIFFPLLPHIEKWFVGCPIPFKTRPHIVFKGFVPLLPFLTGLFGHDVLRWNLLHSFMLHVLLEVRLQKNIVLPPALHCYWRLPTDQGKPHVSLLTHICVCLLPLHMLLLSWKVYSGLTLGEEWRLLKNYLCEFGWQTETG